MSGMLTRSGLRAFSTKALNVLNNVAKQQFTVSISGAGGNAEAVLDYEVSGKNITFVHTDVPSQFQGKGVGKLLAEYAFNYASENKLNVTCQCHFLCKYYQDNVNKYKDLKVKLDPN